MFLLCYKRGSQKRNRNEEEKSSSSRVVEGRRSHNSSGRVNSKKPQGSIGGKRPRPLKATSVSKSKSDSIAECVQQIVLSFIVLVAYPKAFDLVAEVIA